MIHKLSCIAALLLAACASDNSQASAVSASSASSAASAASGGGGKPAGQGSASGKPSASNGSVMTAAKGTYQAAFEAYRAHAVNKLGLPAEQLGGFGPNESIAKLQRGRVGQVWAFEGRPKDAPTPELRGWATSDGVVVTLEQNLGLLFAEAGAWGGGVTPALTAQQLADSLTWAMGSGHTVFTLHPKVPAPELTLKDGAGTLSFHVDFQKPGQGRAPRNISRIEVALTKDQRATLTRTPIPAP